MFNFEYQHERELYDLGVIEVGYMTHNPQGDMVEHGRVACQTGYRPTFLHCVSCIALHCVSCNLGLSPSCSEYKSNNFHVLCSSCTGTK